MKKGFFLVISFFILAMLQVSFLPHFSLVGWVPNLVLISLVILAFVANPQTGIVAALSGGFFLDLYSALPFGFWIILSLALFFTARHILQHYVRLPRSL